MGIYSTACQKLLTIFPSLSSNPCLQWDTHVQNGYIKTFLDPELKTLVTDICGVNVSTTFMTCPKGKQTLGIYLPFLVMIVKNLKKYFSFEVTILDYEGIRRRFRMSNFQSSTRITFHSTVMPVNLADGWNMVQFNLVDFYKRVYNGNFAEVVSIRINANIRLKRIYFTERPLPMEELPREYRLFHPPCQKKRPMEPMTITENGSVTQQDVQEYQPPTSDTECCFDGRSTEQQNLDRELVGSTSSETKKVSPKSSETKIGEGKSQDLGRKSQDSGRKSQESTRKSQEPVENLLENIQQEDPGRKSEDLVRRSQDLARKSQDSGSKSRDSGRKSQDSGKMSQGLARKSQESVRKSQQLAENLLENLQQDEIGKPIQDLVGSSQDLPRKSQDSRRMSQNLARKSQELAENLLENIQDNSGRKSQDLVRRSQDLVRKSQESARRSQQLAEISLQNMKQEDSGRKSQDLARRSQDLIRKSQDSAKMSQKPAEN